MRAIIIEEERFAEICELLQVEIMKLPSDGYLLTTTGLNEQQLKTVVAEVHRRFHFNFVRWAQSHGARCVR